MHLHARLALYNSRGVICGEIRGGEGYFFSPSSSSLDGLFFGQVGVGGGAMICHHISQAKRQRSNVSTKCQVASLVCHLFSFFHSLLFNYWGETGMEEEAEREMRDWRM